MKKKNIILMLVLPAWVTLSAQTTQEQADSIVSKHLSQKTQAYTLYAKADVQEKMTVSTSAGETLELDYACWVYYINYSEKTTGKYIIVNESNGNVVEINAKSNAEPVDLVEWRDMEKEKICACGVRNPAKNLPWLAELIEKAEYDKIAPPYEPGDDYRPGHYLGQIWLGKFKGQDIFRTNMMLGSGGIAFWYFDCSGNHLILRTWPYEPRPDEPCPACNFVGHHHFFIEDKDFIWLLEVDVLIYSPF